jgi:hypothetical protein
MSLVFYRDIAAPLAVGSAVVQGSGSTVQPWIQSATPKKYLIMANPAHNAPQN